MIYITSYQNFILLFCPINNIWTKWHVFARLGPFPLPYCHYILLYCITELCKRCESSSSLHEYWNLGFPFSHCVFPSSSPCVCRNYLQSHPRCQLVSLDEWQKRNHLSYRRFAKVPYFFHGSPVLWFIDYLYFHCCFVPFLCHRYKGEDHWFVLLVSCLMRSPIWFVFLLVISQCVVCVCTACFILEVLGVM